jgi:hypothetical protein
MTVLSPCYDPALCSYIRRLHACSRLSLHGFHHHGLRRPHVLRPPGWWSVSAVPIEADTELSPLLARTLHILITGTCTAHAHRGKFLATVSEARVNVCV